MSTHNFPKQARLANKNSNGLNMVRLAFQRSNLSNYYCVYLLLSSSYLALSA
jgi:hypothetical protein